MSADKHVRPSNEPAHTNSGDTQPENVQYLVASYLENAGHTTAEARALAALVDHLWRAKPFTTCSLEEAESVMLGQAPAGAPQQAAGSSPGEATPGAATTAPTAAPPQEASSSQQPLEVAQLVEWCEFFTVWPASAGQAWGAFLLRSHVEAKVGLRQAPGDSAAAAGKRPADAAPDDAPAARRQNVGQHAHAAPPPAASSSPSSSSPPLPPPPPPPPPSQATSGGDSGQNQLHPAAASGSAATRSLPDGSKGDGAGAALSPEEQLVVQGIKGGSWQQALAHDKCAVGAVKAVAHLMLRDAASRQGDGSTTGQDGLPPDTIKMSLAELVFETTYGELSLEEPGVDTDGQPDPLQCFQASGIMLLSTSGCGSSPGNMQLRRAKLIEQGRDVAARELVREPAEGDGAAAAAATAAAAAAGDILGGGQIMAGGEQAPASMAGGSLAAGPVEGGGYEEQEVMEESLGQPGAEEAQGAPPKAPAHGGKAPAHGGGGAPLEHDVRSMIMRGAKLRGYSDSQMATLKALLQVLEGRGPGASMRMAEASNIAQKACKQQNLSVPPGKLKNLLKTCGMFNLFKHNKTQWIQLVAAKARLHQVQPWSAQASDLQRVIRSKCWHAGFDSSGIAGLEALMMALVPGEDGVPKTMNLGQAGMVVKQGCKQRNISPPKINFKMLAERCRLLSLLPTAHLNDFKVTLANFAKYLPTGAHAPCSSAPSTSGAAAGTLPDPAPAPSSYQQQVVQHPGPARAPSPPPPGPPPGAPPQAPVPAPPIAPPRAPPLPPPAADWGASGPGYFTPPAPPPPLQCSRTVVCTTVKEVQQAVEHLGLCAEVALDAEWAEAAGDTSAQLCLIQLGASAAGFLPATAYVIDMLGFLGQRSAGPLPKGLAPVLQLLEDTSLLKVVHDGRQVVNLLRRQHGVQLQPVLDTQVAAALLAGLGPLAGALPGWAWQASSPLPSLPAEPATLEQLMVAYGMARDMQTGRQQHHPAGPRHRPLTQSYVASAAAAISHLLPIFHRLTHDLGPLAPLASLLSAAHLDLPLHRNTHSLAALATVTNQAPTRSNPTDCLAELAQRLGQPGSSGSYAAGSRGGGGGRGLDLGVVYELVKQGGDDGGCFSLQGVAGGAAGNGSEGAGGSTAEVVGGGEGDEAVQQLLRMLPERVVERMRQEGVQHQVSEVVVDYGRPVRLRLMGGGRLQLEGLVVPLAEALLCLHRCMEVEDTADDGLGYLWGGDTAMADAATMPAADRAAVGPSREQPCSTSQQGGHSNSNPGHAPSAKQLEGIFRRDSNRLALPGMLHRVSAIRGMQGKVLGVTYRIGRHVSGVAKVLEDVLRAACGRRGGGGVLLIGPPGVGKTTLLRDVAHLLSVDLDREVVIVDTSNEIGGDGAIPHECIGSSRRLMVPRREEQYQVLLEAVQNNNPDVVICDEIGDTKEVRAVKTTSQRGVCMVATAHGVTLQTLLKNPDLSPLLGGVQNVILGDMAARGGSKTRAERAGAPAFTSAVEVLALDRWRVHRSVAASMDALLQNRQPPSELRWRGPDGQLLVQFEAPEAARLAVNALAPSTGCAQPGTAGANGHVPPHWELRQQHLQQGGATPGAGGSQQQSWVAQLLDKAVRVAAIQC